MRERARDTYLLPSLGDVLSDKTLLQPPVQLVPGLVWEARSTVLSSLPKAGKSTIACQATAALTMGGDLFGCRAAPVPVAYFSLDEYIGDTARRLVAFGADPHLTAITNERPPSPDAMAGALDAISARLAVIDTISRCWLGYVDDSNDAECVRGWLAPYLEALRSIKCASLWLHHTGKAGLRGLGSVALEAEPDATLVLVHPAQRKMLNADGEHDEDDAAPDDGRRVIQGMTRFTPHIRTALKYEGGRYAVDATPLSRRVRVLRAAGGPNGPFKKGELATLAGGRREATLALIDELRAGGLLAESHGSYTVTDAGRALSTQNDSDEGGEVI
jgi:hypothetical protein